MTASLILYYFLLGVELGLALGYCIIQGIDTVMGMKRVYPKWFPNDWRKP